MTISRDVPAGDLVAAFLEECEADVAFGVTSIHNMPILDAIGRLDRIRFLPTRGEAGAVNMADAFARVRGALGVAITSTGPGAANAAGALLEAWSAGTPLLHVTGQIDVPFLDRHRAFNHEAKDQLAMLASVSKAAFRVWSVGMLPGVLQKAVQVALTPPMGPVSVEIPIDVQKTRTSIPQGLKPLKVAPPVADGNDLALIADLAARAKRPLIWIGGGARHAGSAVLALLEKGFGLVTSVNGRGVVDERHPRSLGAFNSGPAVEALYRSCDFMLIAGSRLRGNETRNYTMPLPLLAQVDADPAAWGRAYPVARFACGEAGAALTHLAMLLADRMKVDPHFGADLAYAKAAAVQQLRSEIGPYAAIADALRSAMPDDAVWVRDVTIANSTWGNRYLPLYGARDSAHALAGGIGQGMPMGIGAHFATRGRRKVVVLCGDGGLFLNVGELGTAVQERADIVLVVMNDKGYGVVRNIQDHSYGGRHYYTDLQTPDLREFARVMGLHFERVEKVEAFGGAMRSALASGRPSLVEVDMERIGPYPVPFGGPPSADQTSPPAPQPKGELLQGAASAEPVRP